MEKRQWPKTTEATYFFGFPFSQVFMIWNFVVSFLYTKNLAKTSYNVSSSPSRNSLSTRALIEDRDDGHCLNTG